MKPLFTVHAGEYLVGSYIEEHYAKKWNVWVPSKDTGIDLLVTDTDNARAVSLQVKFSKDFTTRRTDLLQSKLMAAGWWTHQEKKIEESKADFWVFVLPSFTERRTNFIIIPPAELLRRFRAIHGKAKKRLHSYLWVTKSGRCWEPRGLNNADQTMIALDRFNHTPRDFTQFLNGWVEVEKRLSK